jgi:dTDP-4-dehydrorhamnose 3,5-epimerase
VRFEATTVAGAFLIIPEPIEDERGIFARIWCAREFEAAGLTTRIVQTNMSVSNDKGTLRGLHYQCSPYSEVKVVRCPRGSIFDVAVDLRRTSATYKQWVGVELTEENGNMLYVPEGCAQGLLTLTNQTEIYYHTSAAYSPDTATGVRFDDPAFAIEWPEEIRNISDQDRSWPNFPG